MQKRTKPIPGFCGFDFGCPALDCDDCSFNQDGRGQDLKPLFIPLKREFFFAFLEGTKWCEYRLYGPRWNERTCVPGRAALLSMGYGKQMRAKGRVRDFKVLRLDDLPDATCLALYRCYGDKAEGAKIAAIHIDDVHRILTHITINTTFKV